MADTARTTRSGVPSTRPTRRELVAVLVVTVTFGLWLALWAVVVPVFEAPDEVAHFDAAVQLATGGPWSAPGKLHVLHAVLEAYTQQATLPKPAWSTMTALLTTHPGASTTVNQMTQHPPTAYLVDAAVLRVAHYGSLRWDHAVVVLRLFDALTVMPLAALAWATVRRLTRSHRAGLVGAVALFATPQLASIASSVSNDAPVMLLSGVVVWLVVRVLTGDRRWQTSVGLGVSLGVLVWVKGTGLPAVPFVAVALLAAGWPVTPLRQRVVRAVTTLGVTAGIGAWWWIANVVQYGRVQPNGYTVRVPRPFPPGESPSLGHFVAVDWGTVTKTFWGSPGIKAQVSIGDTLTAVLTVVTVVVVACLAFRRGPDRLSAAVLAVFPVLLLVIQTATSARAYLTTTEVAATQGRYVFPAVLCLVALSALAWRRLPRTAVGRGRLAATLAVASAAVGLYGLAVVSVWFWNAAVFPPGAAASARYAALGPVPVPLVVVLTAAVLAGLAVTVVAVARHGRADRRADDTTASTTPQPRRASGATPGP